MPFAVADVWRDLMPSDVLGGPVYDPKDGSFLMRPGPVIANVVLADKINQANPRAQSALLECMEERQATIDGTSLRMPDPFVVLATQNPIDMAGTYPLPEAQLDRFIMVTPSTMATHWLDQAVDLYYSVRFGRQASTAESAQAMRHLVYDAIELAVFAASDAPRARWRHQRPS